MFGSIKHPTKIERPAYSSNVKKALDHVEKDNPKFTFHEIGAVDTYGKQTRRENKSNKQAESSFKVPSKNIQHLGKLICKKTEEQEYNHAKLRMI